jgi:hypothetical protein
MQTAYYIVPLSPADQRHRYRRRAVISVPYWCTVNAVAYPTGSSVNSRKAPATGACTMVGDCESKANAVQIRVFGQAGNGVGGRGWRVILSVGRLTR